MAALFCLVSQWKKFPDVCYVSGAVTGSRYAVGSQWGSWNCGSPFWSGTIDNKIKCFWNNPGGGRCSEGKQGRGWWGWSQRGVLRGHWHGAETWRHEEGTQYNMWGESVFQVERIASAKALRQEHTWPVWSRVKEGDWCTEKTREVGRPDHTCRPLWRFEFYLSEVVWVYPETAIFPKS